MVIPKIENPFFPQLVGHADRVLQEHDLSLLLCSSDDDPAAEAKRISILAERQIDGLLISPCSQSASAAALIGAAARMPIVQFDQRVPSVRAPFVGVDDAAGIAAVTAHLVAAGRRRVAYVGANTDNWSGGRRRDGFETWARTTDPSALGRMESGDFSREFGHQAARRLLADDSSIDAIVCANDLLALGALDAATDLAIDVPSRLAVTGFDDVNIATVSRPTLTTVRQPVADIVETAIDILLRAIEGEEDQQNDILLPVELIIRGSAP